MKKAIGIIILGLLLSSNANAEYLMVSGMTGFDWGFFGFSGKRVNVDVEKIGDKFYPLFYEDRPIMIEDERVSEYFRQVNDKNKFICKIPVRPGGRDYITRLIHKIWSFLKGKVIIRLIRMGNIKKLM